MHDLDGVARDRRAELHVLEGPARQAELLILRFLFCGESLVGLVDEHQIITFDVEDDGARVVLLLPQRIRVEEPVEQERGIARLGRDAGDAGDVDVRTSSAVEEIEVAPHEIVLSREAGHELVLHAVEVERRVSLGVASARDELPRPRWHEDLLFDARDRYVSGGRYADGEHTFLHSEDV